MHLEKWAKILVEPHLIFSILCFPFHFLFFYPTELVHALRRSSLYNASFPVGTSSPLFVRSPLTFRPFSAHHLGFILLCFFFFSFHYYNLWSGRLLKQNVLARYLLIFFGEIFRCQIKWFKKPWHAFFQPPLFFLVSAVVGLPRGEKK